VFYQLSNQFKSPYQQDGNFRHTTRGNVFWIHFNCKKKKYQLEDELEEEGDDDDDDDEMDSNNNINNNNNDSSVLSQHTTTPRISTVLHDHDHYESPTFTSSAKYDYYFCYYFSVLT
jgi:hypothetical protein